MQIKNILFPVVLCFTFIILPQNNNHLIKKLFTNKKVRIAGYSAELLASLFSYSVLQGCSFHEIINKNDERVPIPSLWGIKYNIIDDPDLVGFISCSLFQVPFLGSIGHALYGLYTEYDSTGKNDE